MKFGIGQPVKRTEDPRFLTGRGTYVSDIALPNLTHAHVVYSTHAHAEITSIDSSRAVKAPGVLAVLTGEDVVRDGLGGIQARLMPEDIGGPKGFRSERPILAVDRVRFVGDRVAVVVAETLAQARNAAELVEIDYRELPVLTDMNDALANDAPLIHEGASDNTYFNLKMGDATAASAAFASAHHVTRINLSHKRLATSSMEPRATLGDYDPARDVYTLRSSNQAPHLLRSEMANYVFKVPESQFHVIVPDVGGGFGLKTALFPEDALVVWAARKIGRPVKWVATRGEALMGDDQGRGQELNAELALDENAKILALKCTALHDVGAYIISAGAVPPIFFGRMLPSVYDIDTIDLTIKAVMTNLPPTTPYRGAGRPEAIFAIERLLDKAAREMGLDRVEIRRRNFIQPEAMPYPTQTHFIYDSGEFEPVLEKTIQLADWNGFEGRRSSALKSGKYRGIGLAYYIDDTGNFNERMDLRFDPSGGLTIVAGTCAMGMGHETTYAQMVSEWLSVEFSGIRFVQGDTAQVPFGRGTYASRSMTVGGSALRVASDRLIDKGKLFAAHLLEADAADIEFQDGEFLIAGTDRKLPLTEVAIASFRPMGIPGDLGLGLEASGNFGVTQASFPNGCHICELEIEPDDGSLVIVNYVVVDDVGRVINPMLVEGQIHGGIAQGVGEALFEGMGYDPATGQLLTGSFMDYCMPRADDFSSFKLDFHEVLCKTNPIGVKGAGEGGTVGATPAVINAILDALSPLEVADISMPATPCKIWQAIQQGQSDKS